MNDLLITAVVAMTVLATAAVANSSVQEEDSNDASVVIVELLPRTSFFSGTSGLFFAKDANSLILARW